MKTTHKHDNGFKTGQYKNKDIPESEIPGSVSVHALPASSFLSFCLIVAAVTSGDSSLMIFEMKVWSFRPNRKMSHCRTDSVSAL